MRTNNYLSFLRIVTIYCVYNKVGGELMAKDVKCNVSTCLYNDSHKCQANTISVTKCNCSHAKNENETECETFKLK